VFWNGRHFEYVGNKYNEVPECEVSPLLRGHITATFNAHRVALVVSCSLVANTRQALESISLHRASVSLPSMLSGGQNANLLGLANGLFDLDTTELRGHTPDWFSLVCLPYAYDRKATCPRWLKVLGQNLEGDADRIALVQEFFGYTLMKSTDGQRSLWLTGDGGNGKSVILAGLHAMLGEENVSTVSLEDFGKRFALAQTLGKLANICPEVGELDKTAEGTLKAYVSGDRMTFERKYKDPFTAPPTARLILSTNNVPCFSDKSDGVWRRLILIPFNRRVPDEERVVGMDKPEFWLQAGEAPGILNWALDGMRRLKKNSMHFTNSAACRAMLEEHRADSDPCRAFLQEHYVADPQATPIPTKFVYAAYGAWCENNGHGPVSSNKFSRQVRRVFGLSEPRPHRFSSGVAKAWLGLAERQLTV
jgi:P4 family phage/plasmid primase-like protien